MWRCEELITLSEARYLDTACLRWSSGLVARQRLWETQTGKNAERWGEFCMEPKRPLESLEFLPLKCNLFDRQRSVALAILNQ